MKRFLLTWLATAAVFSAACVLEEAPGQDEANVEESSVTRNGNLIDRMGRPEITNFLVRVPDFKPGYNTADTFDLTAEQTAKYRGMIGAGIAAWDSFDGTQNWDPAGDGLDLAVVLANDFLVVDPNIVCDVNTDSYLDIELSEPGKHQTCGGRTPNPDVIDRIVNLLIAGPEAGDEYGDGVDGVPRPAVSEYPYLVEPHATPPPPEGEGA